MNYLNRLLACLALLLPALPAWSAYACQINPALTEIKLTYNYFPAATATGTLRMDCTRAPGDGGRLDVWIGMDQTTAGRQATLDTGGSTLGYEVFHGSTTSGTWTNTGEVGPTSTNDGAVSENVNFPKGVNSLTENYTFYVNVPWLQVRPAGIYLDTIPITIRRKNAGGAIIGSGNLRVNISIPRACRFSTPPGPIDVNYTAFQTSAATGTSNFEVTCTLGTTYTLSLDQDRSVIPGVELAYGLSVSLASGTATGNAAAQPYTVNISVDPGQAGRCATSTCSGTDSRTLTVTY